MAQEDDRAGVVARGHPHRDAERLAVAQVQPDGLAEVDEILEAVEQDRFAAHARHPPATHDLGRRAAAALVRGRGALAFVQRPVTDEAGQLGRGDRGEVELGRGLRLPVRRLALVGRGRCSADLVPGLGVRRP